MQKYLLTLSLIDGSEGNIKGHLHSVVDEDQLVSHDFDPNEGIKHETEDSWCTLLWDTLTYHFVPIDENGKIDMADIEKLIELSDCSILEREPDDDYDED